MVEGILEIVEGFIANKPERPVRPIVAIGGGSTASDPRSILAKLGDSGATMHAATLRGGTVSALSGPWLMKTAAIRCSGMVREVGRARRERDRRHTEGAPADRRRSSGAIRSHACPPGRREAGQASQHQHQASRRQLRGHDVPER